MILLNLDRESKVPLFRQVFSQLKDLIDGNTLKPGYRMPSTRELAEKHGVNRSTVYKAYEELWALGYTESRPGSYSVVRKRHKTLSDMGRAKKGLIPWEKKSSEAGRFIYHSFGKMKSGLPERPAAELINLASLDIDHRLFPLDDFKRSINTVLVEQGGEVFKYGECGGYKPLREYVSGRMRIHGIMVEPEEILITNGSQGGLELILKLLTFPGSKVAVEFPTYSYMLPLLEYYKAEILEVPMKKGGMDLERLEQILDEEKPAFVYTIPNFQNPTGITTSQEHRERLLSLCEQYRVPIVEDAFEEEMKYFGKVPLPIKSMDRQHLVLYAGTFSKVLAPGIRVGWIAGEREFIERLTAIKKFSDISSNTLIQSALYEFCRQGYYELHIKRMHREFRKRMHAVINALKDKLANHPHVSWLEPAGGYLLWLKLKKTQVDATALKKIFIDNGVAIAYGDAFYPASFGDGKREGYFEHSIRLSISTLDVKEIKEGISRLAKAVSQIYR